MDALRTHRHEMESSAAMSCPCCGTASPGAALTFWRAEAMPVLSHGLCRTRTEALAVPRAPIELVLCRGCGLIYNRAFDARLLRYERDYENPLHFSPHFRDYADLLARHFVEVHHVRQARVLEIGCGDGQFLAHLCKLGHNTGLGLDPAHDPRRTAVSPTSDVHIRAEAFDSGSLETFPADLICCRHMLEHLDEPMGLLRAVRQAMGGRHRPLVYFEVPNVMHTFERKAVWDIIYEHCLYLAPATLRHLFRLAGFRPTGSGEAYGGQFAWIEAVPGEGEPTNEGARFASECEGLAQGFEQWCRAHMAQMRRELERLAGQGCRTVVWGAGSKTVTMLNVLGIGEDVVEAVVDQNPRKQGHHLVGTGQPIVAPAELRALGPDTVLLMNPLYRHEVTGQLRAMGLDASLRVA